MSNLHYSIPALTALSPTALPNPFFPRAEPVRALPTSLRTHQLMLTNLYVAHHNAYVAAYIAFESQCVAAAGATFIGIHDVIAKQLQQQKEIVLFQTFLWSFKVFVDGLEG
jgi:hypothetical protein